MDTTVIAVIIFLVYLGLFLLTVYMMILFVRMSNDVRKMHNALKDMAYRDTARYISEVENGTISTSAQEQAEQEASKNS